MISNNSNVLIKADGLNSCHDLCVDYPQVGKTILLLFCGYVIIWYLQIGYRMPALGAIRFEFLYATLLTGAAFLFTPKIDTDCPLIPYIVLYFIVIAIQVPFSYDFDRSWEVFVDRIIKFAFMTLFIVAFVRSPTHLKYFLVSFLLACLKMGQEGLIGRITGNLIWENQGIMRLHGSTPLYSHPNSFAGMALGTLPFVYYLWPVSNKYCKILLLIIGILSLHTILYSGSRTGYVGILAFAVFAFLNSKNKKTFLVYFSLLLVLLIRLIPSDYSERFNSIFTQKEKEGASSEARIEILKDSWQILEENPLGVGIAAFPKIRMERFGRSQDTHNLYFEIATNLGIQGLIIFLILIKTLLALLADITKKSQNAITLLSSSSSIYGDKLLSDLIFIKAVSLATSAFIIIRLTLGIFGMDLYEIYWWFAIGITLSIYSMMSKINISINNKQMQLSNDRILNILF
jgi:hypothetical protein